MTAERIAYLHNLLHGVRNPTRPWPESVLHPEGLVGELANLITATAVRPQPKFSLAAALTTFGTLLGRGVKDVTGQYTNLFTFALGLSNGGKDHPAKYPLQLFALLKRDKLLASKVTSDTAIEILLSDYPIRFFHLDEIGHYLGSMKTAGQNNPHLKTVLPTLTELWSTPAKDGTFIGKTRAPDNGGKWKPPRKILVPVVSIYATGSPDRLYDALSYDDLADGSITRYLCFASSDIPTRNIQPSEPFPTDLLQRIDNALNTLGLSADKYGADSIAPTARTIRESEEATEIFKSFADTTDEQLRRADDDGALYLYGKAAENARRIALIISCTRNPDNPTVDRYSAQYGVDLVTQSVGDILQGVRENIARSRGEKISKDIEHVIRKAGIITQSDLTSQTRCIDRRDRTAALLDLTEAGIISVGTQPGTGKKSVTTYTYLGSPQ